MHVRLAKLLLSLRFDAEQALNDYVVDFGPHERGVKAQLFHVRAEGRHTPFKATIAILGVLVLHKGLILLVDGVVRQVSVLGLLTCQICILVLSRGESHQSFSVDVDS